MRWSVNTAAFNGRVLDQAFFCIPFYKTIPSEHSNSTLVLEVNGILKTYGIQVA